MKTALSLLVGSVLAMVGLATPASAAIEIFLAMDGIQSDLADSSHPHTISLLSLSTNVFQQGLNFAGSGAAAAKTQFNPIVVNKAVDKTSPALFLACATGKHIKNATIFVRDEQASFDYFKLVLTDVLVSSIIGSAEAGDNFATEKVTLSFSKIEWDFTPQNLEGLPLSPVTGGFDVKQNRTFNVSQEPPG